MEEIQKKISQLSNELNEHNHHYYIGDAPVITDFKFEGEGCIVSQAGTSIISEVVLGKSTKEIMNMGPEIITDIIGEELALSRPKCSTLGISTVKLAIKELEKIETKKQASS